MAIDGVDVLAATPLFSQLGLHELDELSGEFEDRAAVQGDVLVRQGLRCEGLGVILAGQASVRIDGQERTRLGPGDVFGEVSILLGEAAMADVVALGRLRYLVLDESRCEKILNAHPAVAYKLLQSEVRRLRSPQRWYAATASPVTEASAWAPGSWRTRPVRQQPDWEDRQHVDEVVRALASKPPLVFAGEARRLTEALAEAAAGRAFLLQAGDCAESFREFSADRVRDQLKVTLQMAAVLTYGSGVHAVKVGRIAGQFAKPRSAPVEVIDGQEFPSFRGDIVNDDAPTVAARRPDPSRMLQAYHQSVETLNLLRALTTGGFASLSNVHLWNQEFVAASREGRRYEAVATEIDNCMRFMRACGFDLDASPVARQVDYWTSHEALLLPYEEALTRRDSLTGDWYACSAHMLWIGERTRELDGAHVEFLSGVQNPLGCKLGPAATADEVLALCERLNPDRLPGRLTLVARMGANKVTEALPGLLAATRDAGHPVVWACDPMHANTSVTASGRKTRRFDDILAEIEAFFGACASEGTWPGGLHLELTGDDVTECLGGAEEILEEDLDTNYATACDPRLNGRQSLDLAFRVAELLRASPVGPDLRGGPTP
jgi:3-deoxy-7-phosphoheptulonate synthase